MPAVKAVYLKNRNAKSEAEISEQVKHSREKGEERAKGSRVGRTAKAIYC